MATPSLTVYDFDRCSAIFGPILVDALAQGESITIERDMEVFTKYIGGDGKATRAKTLNKGGKVTIRTMQGSATNDLLSAALAADENAPNGAGIVPFSFFDRSGRAVYSAKDSWLQGWPSCPYGPEAGEREWIIECAQLEMFVGGN